MGFYYPSFLGGDDHHPLWESLLVPPRIQHDIVGISWDMFDILRGAVGVVQQAMFTGR